MNAVSNALTTTDSARILLNILGPYDDHHLERRLTRMLRAHWSQRGKLRCAVCSWAEEGQVQVAHVRALHEFGTTSRDNTAPLCTTTYDGKPINGRAAMSGLLRRHRDRTLGEAAAAERLRMGCHELFDSGLVSKDDIRHVSPERRDAALMSPLAALAGQFGVSSKSRKVEEAKQKLRSVTEARRDAIKSGAITTQGESLWLQAECELISALRRTDNQGVHRALLACQRVLPQVMEGQFDKALVSRFLYEQALALQLGVSQVGLSQTRDCLGASCAAAEPSSKSWAMSELELVHAEFLAADANEVRVRRREWDDRQEAAVKYLDKPERWTMNGLMHRAQVLAKSTFAGVATPQEARVAVEDAWHCRDRMTIRDGWTPFQAIHLVTIEGILLYIEGAPDRALSCLATAVRPMTSGYAKRPEGLKDIARCAALCFEKLGLESHGRQVRDVAESIFDQRSGVVLA